MFMDMVCLLWKLQKPAEDLALNHQGTRELWKVLEQESDYSKKNKTKNLRFVKLVFDPSTERGQ